MKRIVESNIIRPLLTYDDEFCVPDESTYVRHVTSFPLHIDLEEGSKLRQSRKKIQKRFFGERAAPPAYYFRPDAT